METEKKKTVALGAFIDTLILNVVPTVASGEMTRRAFSSDLQQQLSTYKEQAQEEDGPIITPFTFEGCSILMQPKGGTGFLWVMENTKIKLSLSRDKKRALWAQVRLSQEYLWSVRSLCKVLSNVHLFLTDFFGDSSIKLVPSGVDLAVDLVNLDWGTIQNIKESFVSRAQLDEDHVAGIGEWDGFLDGPDAIHRRWRRLTGFPFGKHNAPVSASIYDKHHEIKYKRKEKAWFFDLWREVRDENGEPVWDGESPVWRVEMRLRREALNELMCEGEFHGIDDAFSLEELIPSLWAYLVGRTSGGDDGLPDGWLRYVVPADDKNRSRWPVHPDWKVVQAAFQPVVLGSNALSSEPLSLVSTDPLRFDLRPFIRRRKRKVNTDRMVAQIAGCLVTLQAWRAEENRDPGVAPDLSDTLHYASALIEEYLEKSMRDFSLLVDKKRLLYSIETTA